MITDKCCGEEVSWAGALAIIGRDKDIEKPGLVWQSWKCSGSMHNIVLRYNKSSPNVCYDSQDKLQMNQTMQMGRQIQGYNGLEKELRLARSRGVIFARKFVSSDTHWKDWIQTNLHNSQ